ncbi:hypothetical protein PAMA_006555 [Pampus argenteus]
MTSRAPNPITSPDEYWIWLEQVCTVYSCLIPDVQQLVRLTYKTEWIMCKDEFVFPEAVESGQWPPTKSLTDWLNVEAKNAITKCARKRADFSKVIHCVQEARESVPEFIQRFIQTWDINAGIKRDEHQYLMVQIFVQDLRPNVQAAYKLSVLDWSTNDWKSTINKIMAMHRNDVFSTGNNAPSSKQMMQYVRQQDGQNNNKNRDSPKRGNCHKCGALG